MKSNRILLGERILLYTPSGTIWTKKSWSARSLTTALMWQV